MTEIWTPDRAELRKRPHASSGSPFLTLRGGATAYLHPNLAVEVDAVKGRKVVASQPILEREVVIVDTPYALVPAMEQDEPPFVPCSNSDCNRRIPRMSESRIHCEKKCAVEVSWCSSECRSRDSRRHDMECSWLKELSPQIRATYGDSDFGLLWLIARIVISKQIAGERADSQTTNAMSEDHFDRKGWAAVWNLEGDVHAFLDERVAYWTQLAETYLQSSLLGARLSADETVNLICKVELNSFGLYPGVTGEYPVESFVSRGEYYGGGVYPTAAMFNHACCPNVTHRLDVLGRRMFEANREIKLGEECCISYFDLVEFMDTTARRAEIKKSWSFDCGCTRCVEEGEYELPHFLKEFDLF